jgi:hypothetical protein
MKNLARRMTHIFQVSNLPGIATAAAVGMAMCCSIALAQSGAGSIEGTVTDATGAALPGVSIHVVNQANGVATDAKSNSVGFYQVPDLFTGAYDVTITASGFKAYTTRIELLVAQNAVINPVMTAGPVTQQVTVSGNTVQLITTDSGTLGTTLENERINQLPMNGRSLQTLVGDSTPGTTAGGERVNGQIFAATEYETDGSTTNGSVYGGAYSVFEQDADSVQEVKVVTQNAGAQYGSPSTAVINTKSGTNSLHGSLFETTINNSVLAVAKDRQDPSNFTAPPLVRNEFGASVGGPIVLPHVYHGKDKSFWFFAYERYSDAGTSVLQLQVPTAAMGQGNFSGLISSAGLLQTLYDPATTTSSSNCAATPANPVNPYCRESFTQEYNETGTNVNTIPASEISPDAKLYFAAWQPPTNTSDPLVADNLTYDAKTLTLIPNYTFRLDHLFDENNRAYLRFTDNLENTDWSADSQALNLAVPGIPPGAMEGHASYPGGSVFAGAGYTRVFSPTFFAETILSGQWFHLGTTDGIDNNVDFEKELGLPNNFGETGFPETGGLISNAVGSMLHNHETQITANLQENLTKTVGRHQMQFGGIFHHERIAYQLSPGADIDYFDGLATGVYNPASGANYTALSNTGNANGDFFIGSAYAYTVNFAPPVIHYHINELDGYFQDNYHLSRNLTLNLGLRYEALPGLFIKNGLANSFDLKNDADVLEVPPSTLIAEGATTQTIITNMENIGVNFETPAEAGMPASLFKDYYFNFLPRVGAAYLLGGKHGTVLRGAYGRYTFYEGLNAVADNYVQQAPFVAEYLQNYTAANQAIDGLPDELLRYNDPVQFGVMGVTVSNVVNSSSTTSITPGSISLFSVNPNFSPATTTEANFTIEQPLKWNSALSVSWVGTFGSNLDTRFYYNNAPTTYQWEMATGTVPPTGGASVIGTPQQDTYAATATRPYNNTTWGNPAMLERAGWSNDNALQVNYQRLFHHGFAYQIAYVYSKAMRMGGDSNQDGGAFGSLYGSIDYPAANFPGFEGTVSTLTPAYGTVYAGNPVPPLSPGTPVWQDYHALDRYEDYQLDDTIPKMDILFNGVLDLPFGTGKRFLSDANHFLNELVGGFQLAGTGSVLSQNEQIVNGGEATYWGATSPLEVWKHKYPIQDCRSGVCEHSFMWFNGYLAPTTLPAPLGTCTTNCVNGLPSNYVPYETPIDNVPGTTYYGDNEVQITAPNISNGKATAIAYDAGPKGSGYLSKTMVNGPNNYVVNASIFKVFPITERLNLRFNVDAFNALNVQGWELPVQASGVETNLTSYNAPREIQLTARLTF